MAQERVEQTTTEHTVTEKPAEKPDEADVNVTIEQPEKKD